MFPAFSAYRVSPVVIEYHGVLQKITFLCSIRFMVSKENKL